MYADYTYYTDEWYGTAISAADYPRLATRASDFIDYYTKGKAATSDATDALAKCCCALAEQIQSDERNAQIAASIQTSAIAQGGDVKSESVGGYSVSYATAAEYSKNGSAAREQAKLYGDICLRYLALTGLLYRGGCRV